MFFRFTSPRSLIVLHDVITEKSAIRIVTTVNISNLKSSHFQIFFSFLTNGFKTNFLLFEFEFFLSSLRKIRNQSTHSSEIKFISKRKKIIINIIIIIKYKVFTK